MNVIPTRAASANPDCEQRLAVNLRKKSTREEFERALARCKPEDFDGHTEFYRLTPEQRLEWLCHTREEHLRFALKLVNDCRRLTPATRRKVLAYNYAI